MTRGKTCAAARCMQTHTIVQLLRVILCQQQEGTRSSNPILVCAETHTATDNILSKLIASSKTAGAAAAAAGGEARHRAAGLRVEKEELLRIGDVGRVTPELRRYRVAEHARCHNLLCIFGLGSRSASLLSTTLLFSDAFELSCHLRAATSCKMALQ